MRPRREVSRMRGAATGIGLASDALVMEGIVERRREGDVVVLEAPARRDFWFGHGFVLDAPPARAALDALIARGRTRFAGTGAQKFVVLWERARPARTASRTSSNRLAVNAPNCGYSATASAVTARH